MRVDTQYQRCWDGLAQSSHTHHLDRFVRGEFQGMFQGVFRGVETEPYEIVRVYDLLDHDALVAFVGQVPPVFADEEHLQWWPLKERPHLSKFCDLLGQLGGLLFRGVGLFFGGFDLSFCQLRLLLGLLAGFLGLLFRLC